MLRPLVLLAVIVALAVVTSAQPAQAQEEVEVRTGGIVAIDCDSTTEGIQDSCVYDTGDTFLVQIHIVEAPPDGYTGFELHISWTVPQLAYRPSEEFEDEFLEQRCSTTGRTNVWVRWRPRPEVVYICLNPPGSDIRLSEGVPIEVEITCWAEGTGTLSPAPEHHPSLLWIRDTGIAPIHQFRPLASDASVTCRPKSGQLGDIDCSGFVDSIDASLLLQFNAGLLEQLTCDYKGDMTQNGRLDSRDALLILQFDAGLIERLPVL